MASNSMKRSRAFAAASGVGVVAGIVSVLYGSTPVATAGVVVIILSVVAFLLAVGLYFGSDEDVGTATGAP